MVQRKAEQEPDEDDDFMLLLEDGVRRVLKNRKATAAERLKAVESGTKLMLMKHKIKMGDDDSNFFG